MAKAQQPVAGLKVRRGPKPAPALNLNSKQREQLAIELLPGLLRTARMIHGGETEARTAALCAASSLAGIVGWTPEMVKAIEGK